MSLVEQYIKEYREKLSYSTQIKVSQIFINWADGEQKKELILEQPHYLAVWENVMWIPTNDASSLNQIEIYDTNTFGSGEPFYRLYRQLGAGLPNNYHYAVSYTELILPPITLLFFRNDPTGEGIMYIPAFKIVPYPSL